MKTFLVELINRLNCDREAYTCNKTNNNYLIMNRWQEVNTIYIATRFHIDIE